MLVQFTIVFTSFLLIQLNAFQSLYICVNAHNKHVTITYVAYSILGIVSLFYGVAPICQYSHCIILLTGLVDEFPARGKYRATVLDDGKPMLTLTYADGPGYKVHRMKNGHEVPRKDLTHVDTSGFELNCISFSRNKEICSLQFENSNTVATTTNIITIIKSATLIIPQLPVDQTCITIRMAIVMVMTITNIHKIVNCKRIAQQKSKHQHHWL